MGRILCIDYGRRRCGLAVTDPLRIISSPLDTVATPDLEPFLKAYIAREPVDIIVMGYPRTLSGEESQSMNYIRPALGRLRKLFPTVRIDLFDERFTSALAQQAMIEGGMPRSKRREKGAVDAIAAAIILNDYIQSQQYRNSK